ncbi:MAG: TonB-dependent receptor [Alphaproteobacteria bacterium]|nr:TonB-dependent receptor [Alphaproteobacteria bacterium]
MRFRLKSFLVLGAAPAALAWQAGAQDAPASPRPVEKVVVTASPISKSRDGFSTLVGTVDRDDVTREGGLNIADSLSQIPGVSSTSFAAGAGRPVIRGFDASRVRVLENGLGSFDVSDISPDHGVPIDPLALQRIEIVRGPATLRYGSQAIGGVVNAINNRIPTSFGNKPFSGDLHFAAGSVDSSSEIAGLADGQFGNFAWHLDGVKQDRDDYDVPIAPGSMINSAADGLGYSAGGSFVGSSGYIGAAYVRFESEYGIPGEDAFIPMAQDKGLFAAEWRNPFGGLAAFRVNAGVSDYRHDEVVPGVGTAQTFLDKQYEIRSELVTEAVGPFSAVALGVQLQNRDFRALGEAEEFLQPTMTNSIGIYGFADVPISKRLNFEFGARYESTEVEGTPVTDVFTVREFEPVSASAGLVFKANEDLTFGFSAFYAERAPNQVELYARGPHEATGTFEVGDPTLDIEKAVNLEANARLTLPRVTAELTVFLTNFDGFIFGQLTGNLLDEDGTPNSAGDFEELFHVARDATFVGGEFEAAVLLGAVAGGEFNLDLMADVVQAEFDGGDKVPRLPPVRVGGGLRFEGDMIDVYARVTHAFDQDDIAVNETPTGGYTRVDAGLTWHVAKTADDGQINVSLIGRNLTDEEIRNHVAFNKDEVAMPGRDVRLVLSMRY